MNYGTKISFPIYNIRLDPHDLQWFSQLKLAIPMLSRPSSLPVAIKSCRLLVLAALNKSIISLPAHIQSHPFFNTSDGIIQVLIFGCRLSTMVSSKFFQRVPFSSIPPGPFLPFFWQYGLQLDLFILYLRFGMMTDSFVICFLLPHPSSNKIHTAPGSIRALLLCMFVLPQHNLPIPRFR